MPNLPISHLPISTPLTGSELFVDVQDGETRYTTLQQITTYVTSSIPGATYNSSASNSYLIPVNITVAEDQEFYLTGSLYENTSMIHLDWSGSTGTMNLYLPDATTTTNTHRSIRFITDNTFSTSTRAELLPLSGSGQTVDGGAGSYTINKAYEGIMVWSDGTEWYRVQTKAG